MSKQTNKKKDKKGNKITQATQTASPLAQPPEPDPPDDENDANASQSEHDTEAMAQELAATTLSGENSATSTPGTPFEVLTRETQSERADTPQPTTSRTLSNTATAGSRASQGSRSSEKSELTTDVGPEHTVTNVKDVYSIHRPLDINASRNILEQEGILPHTNPEPPNSTTTTGTINTTNSGTIRRRG